MGKPFDIDADDQFDPLELQTNLNKAFGLWQQFLLRAAGAALKTKPRVSAGDMAFQNSALRWAANLVWHPFAIAQANYKLLQDQSQLGQRMGMRMLGFSSVNISDEASLKDRRFKDPAWRENPVGETLMQSYLNVAEYCKSLINLTEGLPEHEAKKAVFFLNSLVDALSPNNYASTNPQVWKMVYETQGANLVKGMENLLNDFQEGELRIRMTDMKAFELGKDIATTPGKVVFRNALMELIQYNPSTDKVRKRPLLIVPPWINKFYILDLREQNSYVKWAVDQGHTVFIISWTNPGSAQRDLNFEDYLKSGTLAALDAIEAATGEPEVNVAGYCLGGTLTGTTLAWLTANQDERIKSATFFTTLLDFSEPGEIGVFLDEPQIVALEQRMDDNGGYLDGKNMGSAFNMLRANDLIWSFFVNLYLLGKDPMPFDLLFWNSDSTRMPAAMHSFYLRNMYLENKLCQPNGIKLLNTPLDLSQVKTPVYFVSAYDDHIAPWRSTYNGAQLFAGPVRFVLGQSGHIAGIINPVSADKYGHWINEQLPASSEEWFKNAQLVKKSWWHDWDQWVSQYADGEVEARIPGSGQLSTLGDAPGTYVRVKAN
ncbi:MAG: class I poly(R)-hydroxyalkanoic acid synthase [Thiothrix sp.]|nr:MAG: class I poly(R)-hydroxyalkanoic acid synthase [Thiothrix sp.]